MARRGGGYPRGFKPYTKNTQRDKYGRFKGKGPMKPWTNNNPNYYKAGQKKASALRASARARAQYKTGHAPTGRATGKKASGGANGGLSTGQKAALGALAIGVTAGAVAAYHYSQTDTGKQKIAKTTSGLKADADKASRRARAAARMGKMASNPKVVATVVAQRQSPVPTKSATTKPAKATTAKPATAKASKASKSGVVSPSPTPAAPTLGPGAGRGSRTRTNAKSLVLTDRAKTTMAKRATTMGAARLTQMTGVTPPNPPVGPPPAEKTRQRGRGTARKAPAPKQPAPGPAVTKPQADAAEAAQQAAAVNPKGKPYSMTASAIRGRKARAKARGIEVNEFGLPTGVLTGEKMPAAGRTVAQGAKPKKAANPTSNPKPTPKAPTPAPNEAVATGQKKKRNKRGAHNFSPTAPPHLVALAQGTKITPRVESAMPLDLKGISGERRVKGRTVPPVSTPSAASVSEGQAKALLNKFAKAKTTAGKYSIAEQMRDAGMPLSREMRRLLRD